MRSSQWKHLRALSPSVDEKSPVGCSPTGLLISVRRRHLYLPPLPERGLHLAQVAPNLLRIGPRTRQARLGKVCKDRHGFGTTHGGRQRLRRAPVQEAIRFIRTRCLSILFSVFLSKRASFEGRRPSALRAFTPSLAAEKARENAPMTACGRHGIHPPLAEAIPRALIRQGLSRHILGASRLRYSTVP